ncbi:MAG: helix-turn-helix transcriptional regulator [Clostridia bacterium]|nr:helix-turn-helix transcriptional regulator [Clostridia bacterium]
MKTSKILKELRIQKGVSMDAMVEELRNFDVSPSKSMISRWENGKAEPSMEYARVLAKYYNVSLDYLLGIAHDVESTLSNDKELIIKILNNHGYEIENNKTKAEVQYQNSKYEISNIQLDEYYNEVSEYAEKAFRKLIQISNTKLDSFGTIAAHATKDLTEEDRDKIIDFVSNLLDKRK